MAHQNSTKPIVSHLFASLLVFNLIFPLCSFPTYKAKESFQTLYETISEIENRQAALNLTKVYVIYTNVFVVEKSDTSEYVSVVLKGLPKQVAWLVLTSPWKPVFITSNSTNQPFNELNYDKRTMSTNPLADTTHESAWDYDSINQVVFIKLQLAATVTVTIHYVTPTGPQIPWLVIAIVALALAVMSATAYLYYKRRKRISIKPRGSK